MDEEFSREVKEFEKSLTPMKNAQVEKSYSKKSDGVSNIELFDFNPNTILKSDLKFLSTQATRFQ